MPALPPQKPDIKRPKRFLPFSLGSRDCVGQTLAKLNLTTTLAQLYGNFSFALADEVTPLVHCHAKCCANCSVSCRNHDAAR